MTSWGATWPAGRAAGTTTRWVLGDGAQVIIRSPDLLYLIEAIARHGAGGRSDHGQSRRRLRGREVAQLQAHALGEAYRQI